MVTRRQAVQSGCTERELRTLTAVNGAWIVVRRGVYVERERWESLGDDDRWRLRDWAAHLNLGVPHVMSHDSAARAHGMPLLRPDLALVHITRPGVSGSRTEHGVKHHLTRLPLDWGTFAAGMPVTDLARTALDLGREHGMLTGVVACDDALHRGVPRRRFDLALADMTNWPGVTQARAAYEHADEGAESPGESLSRVLVEELGWGRPETQFPVPVGRGVAWCDLRLGRHVFEFDGRTKYRRRAEGGVADRPVEDILWDEKKREQAICSLGFGMSRLIWDDLFGAARDRTLIRLAAEYQLSVERYGVVLPAQLADFARRFRGQRNAG